MNLITPHWIPEQDLRLLNGIRHLTLMCTKDARLTEQFWFCISQMVFLGEYLPDQCQQRYAELQERMPLQILVSRKVDVQISELTQKRWSLQDQQRLLNGMRSYFKWEKIAEKKFGMKMTAIECRECYEKHFSKIISEQKIKAVNGKIILRGEIFLKRKYLGVKLKESDNTGENKKKETFGIIENKEFAISDLTSYLNHIRNCFAWEEVAGLLDNGMSAFRCRKYYEMDIAPILSEEVIKKGDGKWKVRPVILIKERSLNELENKRKRPLELEKGLPQTSKRIRLETDDDLAKETGSEKEKEIEKEKEKEATHTDVSGLNEAIHLNPRTSTEGNQEEIDLGLADKGTEEEHAILLQSLRVSIESSNAHEKSMSPKSARSWSLEDEQMLVTGLRACMPADLKRSGDYYINVAKYVSKISKRTPDSCKSYMQRHFKDILDAFWVSSIYQDEKLRSSHVEMSINRTKGVFNFRVIENANDYKTTILWDGPKNPDWTSEDVELLLKLSKTPVQQLPKALGHRHSTRDCQFKRQQLKEGKSFS